MRVLQKTIRLAAAAAAACVLCLSSAGTACLAAGDPPDLISGDHAAAENKPLEAVSVNDDKAVLPERQEQNQPMPSENETASATEKYLAQMPEVRNCLQELDNNANSVFRKTEPVEADAFSIGTLGGYVLTEQAEYKVREMLSSVYEPGFTMGFMMLDIHSGRGISFNSDAPYYSASSTKASFVVSLVAARPDIIARNITYLTRITVNSDNNSYYMMEYNYGQDIHKDYAATAGVRLNLDEGGYALYSTEDLTRLWLANYDYFCTGEEGEQVGCWFETPVNSAIWSVLGNEYVTRSKSGWISGMLYNVSIDAGIVYAHDNPYVVVIMSDFPSAVEELQDTVRVLDDIHNEIVSGS